jgi:hypothetical protein
VVGIIIGHSGGKLRIRELEGRVAELSQEAEALRAKQRFLSEGTAKDGDRSWITNELGKAANNLKKALLIVHKPR